MLWLQFAAIFILGVVSGMALIWILAACQNRWED